MFVQNNTDLGICQLIVLVQCSVLEATGAAGGIEGHTASVYTALSVKFTVWNPRPVCHTAANLPLWS